MGGKRLAVLAGLVVAVAAGGPGRAGAQTITVAGGATSYDLAGVGTTWVAAASYQHVVTGPLRAELGVSLMRYGADGAGRETLLMPEFGVTLALPAGPASVLLSAGGGASVALGGIGRDEPTLFSGVAVEVPTGSRFLLRPGLRLRWIDPWAGTVADFTMGVGVRLGP